MGTFMIHRHTRPDTPRSNGSLVTAIKFRDIFTFHAASLLLFTTYEKMKPQRMWHMAETYVRTSRYQEVSIIGRLSSKNPVKA
jgi:hypothetical protein